MRARQKVCSIHFLTALLALGGAACPDPDRRPEATNDVVEEKDSESRPMEPVIGSEDPETVVATVGDVEITLGEVDEDVAAELHQARMEHMQSVYQLRRSGIDRMIAKKLFSEEADRLGLEDEEELIVQSVERGTPYPSDEEARAFYEQNRQMMGDQPFEAVQPRVMEFLHHQKKQERFTSLLEEMREKAEVNILLEEPRVEVEAEGPSKGPKDAPVTIVEFSDFLCPYCARGKDVMEEVREAYGDEVRLVFRLFPTIGNEQSVKLAEAAVCADRQGKFWEVHQAFFEADQPLSDDDVEGVAEGIDGLDVAELKTCLIEGKARQRVMDDVNAGRAVGVEGSPAYYVNGIPVLGAQPFETFEEIIDNELGADGTDALGAGQD